MNKILLLAYFIFGISTVFAAPVNDNCGSATPLTINSGNSCTVTSLATFVGATVSPEANSCTATVTGDIWYQFTATATSHTISLTQFTGTPQPVAMVLYEGADCATLAQVYCSLNNVILATSLNIGTTYKLRLYFNTPSPSLTATIFRVCINTPPPPADNNQSDCVITTINYDFESPAPTATTFPIFLNHNVVPGWRTTASDQMMEFWPVPNYENVPSYSGNQFIELNANLVSGVYQDYQTPEVTTFTYAFAHRGRQGTDTCQLLAGPPGGPYTAVGSPVSTGNSAWSYNTGTYNVPSGQTVTRFIFQSVSSVGGPSVGNYLDAITFTANNGILSPNPMYMDCGDVVANVSAAGTGTWVAHGDNPGTVTISNASANNTTFTDFSSEGTYQFDWVTQYCTSTLEISFSGDEVPPPVVSNVTYCQGETAVPLTAEGLPGYFISWFDGAAPTPSTANTGSFNFYVSQVAPGGCESVAAVITVTVNPPGDAVTGFTLPASACEGEAVILPSQNTGFTPGGTYSAEPGLIINGNSGEIDPATSTPGDYNVVYTVSPNDCTAGGNTSVPFTVNPLPATPDLTIIHPDCVTATGTITVNSPVGSGYTYSIDGSDYQPGVQFNSLAAGTYDLSVQNTDGCITVLSNVVINPAPVVPVSPGVSLTQPDCTTAAGIIEVTTPLGAAYTYSINGTDYQASPVFNNVAAGGYTVTVLHQDGCSSDTNATINPQPPSPAAPVATVTQPNCATSTGVITVNSPLGSGLTYSLDGTNYQPGAVFSGLAPGDYTITVKNSVGCTATSSTYSITPAPAPVPAISATVTQTTCASATGGLQVTAPTGAQYTYSVNGVDYQSSPIFNNLAAGSYTLTTTNTDGCFATYNFVINVQPPTPATPVANTTQPDCFTATGTLSVSAPTGGGLTYSINGINWQSSAVFSGLAPGNYNITVKNTQGCTATSAVYTIDPAPAPVPAVTRTLTQPDCFTATGSVSVVAPVGSQYTYSLNGVDFQSATLFENVAPGSYTLTVINTDGCQATSALFINDAPIVPSTPVVSIAQPDCNIQSGTLTVTSPIANSFTYSIDGVNFQPGSVFSGLGDGDYTVTVKSGSGCTASSGTYHIEVAPAPAPSPLLSASQPDCNTGLGAIAVAAPLGAGYSYSIDGTIFQPGNVFNGLTPGTYTILAMSPDGCIAGSSININPAPNNPAIADLTLVQPDCNSATGTIIVNSPIGAGLSYSINGTTFQYSPTFTGLEEGTYTVTVKNMSGCISVTNPFNINTVAQIPPVPVITATQATCTDPTGSITVTSPIGAQYTYSIDGVNFQAGTVFSNLPAGVTYNVTVSNTSGCTKTSWPLTIHDAPLVPAVPDVTITQPDCSHQRGYIVVNSPVGPDIRYSLNGISFQPGPTFTNMVPGNYTVTIRNGDGCTASYSFTIDAPPPVTDPGTISGDANVCEGATIEFTATVPDGVWSVSDENRATIDQSGVLTALTSGNVILYYTVQDTGECPGVVQASVWVTGAPEPVLEDTVLCQDPDTQEYSSVSLNTGLSAADYSFVWYKDGVQLGDTEGYITAVEPGEYSVEATSLLTGCTGTVTATVGVSSRATVEVVVGEDFAYSQSITVNVVGGSGDYEYQLNAGGFQDSNVFNGIHEGEYLITTRDKNGCGITISTALALNYPRFFSPNGDGDHDTWFIEGLRGRPDMRVYIFDRYGKIVGYVGGNSQGWDGTLNGYLLPATDYWFTLDYISSNGQHKEFKAHFSLLR